MDKKSEVAPTRAPVETGGEIADLVRRLLKLHRETDIYELGEAADAIVKLARPAPTAEAVREACALVIDNSRAEWHKNMMACEPGGAKAKRWAQAVEIAEGLANVVRALDLTAIKGAE